MNLFVTFVHTRKPAKRVGPIAGLRLQGGRIRESATGAVLALQREHQWEVDGERYFRLDAQHVSIRFARSEAPEASTIVSPPGSRAFGPFGQFSVADGIAYADERVFASLDAPSGAWFCYDDGNRWPLLIVSDAASA